MKRQIYGMDPEERWQEQIEDYCAIHYPSPKPFADWCPLFREDFGFVYEQLKKADEERRAVAKASDDLRGVMDENEKALNDSGAGNPTGSCSRQH